MKKTNRFLAALLSVLMVVTMLAPLTAMQAIAATDVTITDLMTDNVKNPVGIDNTTPHFSWKMQSSTTGQKQTAYEIIVSTDKTFQDSSAVVWNPGKVSSDQSIDIAYQGTPLQSSTTYYWTVKVWDKDGVEVSASEPASFETALFEGDAWDDAEWLRLRKSTDPDPDAPPEEGADLSKYTIETNLKFQDAVGIVFAATDASHFFMWQINNNMEQGVEGTWVRPHRWNPGGALFNPENIPNFNGYKLPIDLVAGQDYNIALVVDVTASTVELLIDGTSLSKINCGDVDLSYGKIGFRQATNTNTHIDEKAWVDDLKVTANDGTIVFYQDFALANDTQFNAGSVEDGRLYVSSEGGSDKVTLQKESANYYRLDADFTINEGKAAILYGSNPEGTQYFYSTIDPAYKSGTPTVVQAVQYAHGGQAYDFDRGSINNVSAADLVGKQHHITVVANPNGNRNEVRVYIDGVEAKYHDNLDIFAYDGKVGFVSTEGSDASFDNICVKINGEPKLYENFSEENTFNGGSVENGTLRVSGSTRVFSNGSIGSSVPVEPVGPAHYRIDTDITMTGDAIGVVFSAADTSNMYMWQLNGVDHAGELYLRPHIWVNGTPHYAEYERNINQFFTYDQMLNQEHHLTIEVNDKTITTSIDGIVVDTFTSSFDVIDGKVGFRSGAAGETGLFDNFKVTTIAEDGVETVQHEYNFDDNKNPFENGKVVNGKFMVTDNSGAFFLKDTSKQGTPIFRKEFEPTNKVVSAKVYATSLGVYDLYVNGQRVGYTAEDGSVKYDEMKPGWTDYNYRVLYYTHDITDLINQNGVNAIAAMVGTGWWTGRISYNTYGTKDMAFMAKILLTYADGTTQVINTDQTWKASLGGPIRENDIWDGETYDANYDYAWSNPGYDETEWETPAISTDFKGTVSAHVGPTIQVRDELNRTPETVTVYQGSTETDTTYGEINVVSTPEPGETFTLKAGQTVVFDLGQNMVGWPNITVKGAQNTEVTMRFGEMLNDTGASSRGNDGPAGSIYTANYRSAKSTGTYVLKGDENGESYRPTFSFYGFRYVEMTASADIEISNFVAEVLGSVTTETGSIETSSADINQLYSNILWGQRGNYLSVPTDCPQRDERLGWTGDTQIFAGAASYNADVDGFFQKWLQDARDSQQAAGGAYTDTVPRSAAVGAGNAAWGDAGIIVPYTMYKMYGDTQTVKDMYESMTTYMNWLAARGYEGAGTGYGDWLSYDDNNDGEFRRLIAMAYYATDAQMMAEMAQAIDNTQDAEKYTTLYGEIKQAFQDRFVNADGSLKKTQQTAYLMALKADLLPNEESTQMALNSLLDRIKNNGNKLATGFVGTGTITQTLSDYGQSNMAYTLLLQRENPSWLYSVDQGATTIWERWNSYTLETGFGDVSMNSFNHYSYGAVAEWMYADMVGIEADSANPGFKHIILQPQPDTRTAEEIPANETKMNWVKGSYNSMYGEIVSNWSTENGVFDYSAVVPANTTATFRMPMINADSDAITINGTEYTLAELKVGGCRTEGVTFTEMDGTTAVFELLSGSYSFVEGKQTVVPEDTDKSILNRVIKDAEELQKTDEYLNAIPMVQESFDAALAAAKEVADNPQASQEQINSAWITLMNEIHKLGFQKGDKSGLQAAYDEATALDQDEYEDGEAKDNFNLAIENAKAVLDDENAVQSEIDRAKAELELAQSQLVLAEVDKTQLKKVIDQADTYLEEDFQPEGWPEFEAALKAAKETYDNEKATKKEVEQATNDLLGAMFKLQYRQDKTELNKVIEYAQGLDLNEYTESSAAGLSEALNKALEVQADKGVYQPQIREATAELVEALLNLRYKADKSLLEKAVAEAEAIDVSGYSAEAVESYNAAKAKAEELLNNNDLSREDQEKIDEATAELNAAIRALKAEVKGDANVQTQKAAPKTGEVGGIAAVAGLMLLAGAAAALGWKKRR